MASEQTEEHPAFHEVDPTKVGRVATRVRLRSIRLVQANALFKADPKMLDPGWGERVQGTFDAGVEVREDDHFEVIAFFTIKYWADRDGSQIESAEDEFGDIEVEAAFKLSYELVDPQGVSDDDLKHFAVYNATFNAWPYWREYAQSTTQRFGVPTLLIPLFVFPGPGTPKARHDETSP